MMDDNYFKAQYRVVPKIDYLDAEMIASFLEPGGFDYVTPAMDGDEYLFIKEITILDGLNVVWSYLKREDDTRVYIGKAMEYSAGIVLFAGRWRESSPLMCPNPEDWKREVLEMLRVKVVAAIRMSDLPDLGVEVEDLEEDYDGYERE